MHILSDPQGLLRVGDQGEFTIGAGRLPEKLPEIETFGRAAVIGMNEIQRTMAEHLRLVISQEPDDRGIDERETAAPVCPIDDVLGILHDKAMVFGLDGEEQFHLLPFLQLPGQLIHQLGVVIFQPEGFQNGVGRPVRRVDHEQREEHGADRHRQGLLMVESEESQDEGCQHRKRERQKGVEASG